MLNRSNHWGSRRPRHERRCIRVVIHGSGGEAWDSAGDCRECGWELNSAGDCENHQCPLSSRYAARA